MSFKLVVLRTCLMAGVFFVATPIPLSTERPDSDLEESGHTVKNLNSGLCQTFVRPSAKPWPFWVSHAIHSLTVADLQRFFDSAATDVNFIPTVNRDLTADNALLSHAPDLGLSSVKSDFKTAAMRSIDAVLTKADDPNWNLRRHNALEKLVHVFHMEEIWTKAKEQFEVIAKAPPTSDACQCLLDIENNGILKYLRLIALAIREPSLINDNGLNQRPGRNQPLFGGFDYSLDYKNLAAGKLLPENPKAHGTASGVSTDWAEFKEKMDSTVNDDYNTALFVSCALLKAKSQAVKNL